MVCEPEHRGHRQHHLRANMSASRLAGFSPPSTTTPRRYVPIPAFVHSSEVSPSSRMSKRKQPRPRTAVHPIESVRHRKVRPLQFLCKTPPVQSARPTSYGVLSTGLLPTQRRLDLHSVGMRHHLGPKTGRFLVSTLSMKHTASWHVCLSWKLTRSGRAPVTELVAATSFAR